MAELLEWERAEHTQTRQWLWAEIGVRIQMQRELAQVWQYREDWACLWTTCNDMLLQCNAERLHLVQENTQLRQQLGEARDESQSMSSSVGLLRPIRVSILSVLLVD